MVLTEGLKYINRGWAVIPVHSVDEDGRCSCGQMSDYMTMPIHQIAKHPYTEHGHKDASHEASQLYLWWQMWPDANIAIVTGFKSKLIVIDIDVKNKGFDSLARLERLRGPLPKTVRVKSGGGGEHIYFNHPGIEVRGRRGMKPGIDVSADGGKIVAPPSRHKSGNRYQWKEGHSPEDVKIADLPRWLLLEIQTKRTPIPRRAKLKPWYQI